MKVYIEKEQKEKKIKFEGSVKELLIKLKINSETVIVTKNDELISINEKISDKDKIKILSVISGG